MKLIVILIFVLNNFAFAQFAPPAGQPGSTAIYKESPVFTGWAQNVEIYRGYVDISDKSLGFADYGDKEYIFGIADGKVLSLGDSGVVVIKLDKPVFNGDSWDFAVFENGFNDEFLELAFVEVSSDGDHYYRFPAVSFTDTTVQTGTFGATDATKIHNLAGKYRVNYGTPFDLDFIEDNNLLDKNNIRFIKIIDVIGSLDDRYATYDSKGNKINDPFPTPFNSGGFDLDAVGIIHQKIQNSNDDTGMTDIIIYPNPVVSILQIRSVSNCISNIEILDVSGSKYNISQIYGSGIYDLSSIQPGMYFIKIDFGKDKTIIRRIIKE